MPLSQTTHCTYADYLTWDTEQKYELFDGTPVMPGASKHSASEYRGCFASAAPQLP